MIRPLILVVDDEPQVHRFLRPALEAAGYAVERAENAAEGLRLAASLAPEAVLLDLGLPDLDGQGVISRLREFSDVPVLVISARAHEAEKVAALDGGADDYLEKPFGVAELLARIRTAMRHRRARTPVPEQLVLAGLRVDFAGRMAFGAEGERLALTPREWRLLAMLAQNAGRVLTHRQLLVAVWGPAHATDMPYLRVYVGQLRQKLGASAGLLRTEAGVGYRLAGE